MTLALPPLPSADCRQPIILGLSGGADSVCLLDLLYRAGYRIIAAHVNFHLRGEESDRDEHFVRELRASRYPDVELRVREFDTQSYAAESGVSIEMAARELRYGWFEQLRRKRDAAMIAVAHHADDQVETALLNISRGTGGKGIAAMTGYDEERHLWRPLLSVRKEEILEYLSERNLPHVEDSTNDDTSITRNLIRKRLIPLFEEINPSFRRSMLDTISHIREEQEYIDRKVKNDRRELWEEASANLSLRGDRYALFRILAGMGLSPTQVDDVLSRRTESGALFTASDGTLWELFRGQLYRITLPRVEMQPAAEGMIWGELVQIHFVKSPEKGSRVRPATGDDTFYLRGMRKGRKRVFDFLKECGIPSVYRPYCPVLVDGQDRVLLVLCRHRGVQPFALTPISSSPLSTLLTRGG